MKTMSILVLCSLVFVGATPVAAQTPPNPQTIASATAFMVNGESLPAYEIQFAMQAISTQMQMRGEQVEQQKLITISTQEAIKNRLLLQEARRIGLKTDPAQVKTALEEIKKRAGGEEELATGLGKVGVTLEQFESSFADSQLIQYFIETKIVPNVAVADEDVTTFFNENKKNFIVPDTVRARHILFSVNAESTPEEKAAARLKAAKARERALAGEDFAALAKELSEGPSAPNGGDLGFFGATQMVKPFSDAAFALQPGGIAEVVETQFGFHVIKVEERKESGLTPIEEAGPQIRAFLAQRGIGRAITELSDKLLEKAKIEPANSEAETPPEFE